MRAAALTSPRAVEGMVPATQQETFNDQYRDPRRPLGTDPQKRATLGIDLSCPSQAPCGIPPCHPGRVDPAAEDLDMTGE